MSEDVMFDVLLNRMREGDDDSGGGADQYVKQMVYITDSETTNATLHFGGGTHLEFTQPLQGLTFASVESSHDESEVVFTAGTAFPASDPVLPINASVLGELSIEAGKKYLLNIRDATFVCGEFTVVGSDLTRGVWYWDSTGTLDTSEIHGQTYLAGATIAGGTLRVNSGAVVDAITFIDDTDATAIIGGTVAAVHFDTSTYTGQSVGVYDGYVGSVGASDYEYFSATISGGTVGELHGGSSPGTITVSDGLVIAMTPFAESGGSATISGGTVLAFTASGSGTLMITGGYVGSISGGNNDLNVDISGGIIGTIDRDSIGGGSITITGGTILDEVAE